MTDDQVISILKVAQTALQTVTDSANANIAADQDAITGAQADLANQQKALAEVQDALDAVTAEIAKLQGTPTP